MKQTNLEWLLKRQRIILIDFDEHSNYREKAFTIANEYTDDVIEQFDTCEELYEWLGKEHEDELR